jgi:uncharacterized protein (DUF58 family)
MSLSRLTLWLVGIILLLAIIGIWAGPPVQGLWRWPAALLIIVIAWERLHLATNYTIERQLPAMLGLGEAVAYSVTVSNLTATTLRIETQADYPDSVDGDNTVDHWALRGNEALSKQFSITPTQLGASTLGKLYLKQLGLFGLCWWTRVIDDHVEFAVEPTRLDKISRLSGLQQMGSRNSLFQHSSGVDLLELRDYRHGDSVRNIDWKATARRGKQVIRRFEREHRLEIVVLIDCGRSSRIQCERLDRLHHYVNVAAKLTEFAALQGDRIACIAYAQQAIGKVAMSGGIAAVKKIRQLLGGLSAANETANALNAAFEVKQMLKHRGLVVFLTEIEQPEAAAQLIQAGQLLATKHQVLIASLDDPVTANILRQPARHWADPYRHFAALEYQQGRELSLKQMQRNGVAITTATVKYLDQQVLTYYQTKRDKIGSA